MKESKVSLLELINRYYKTYSEYQEVFNTTNIDKEKLTNEFLPYIKSGDASSEDFIKKAKSLYIDRAMMVTDISYYKSKLLNLISALLITSEEDLPDEIANFYNVEKKNEYKTMFSVEKGKLVQNTKQNANDIPKQEYERILNYIQYEHNLQK